MVATSVLLPEGALAATLLLFFEDEDEDADALVPDFCTTG